MARHGHNAAWLESIMAIDGVIGTLMSPEAEVGQKASQAPASTIMG